MYHLIVRVMSSKLLLSVCAIAGKYVPQVVLSKLKLNTNELNFFVCVASFGFINVIEDTVNFSGK